MTTDPAAAAALVPLPLAAITSYHAHLYFDGPAERAHALWLRDRIAERFPVALGRIHDRLVGPHSRPMYQVAFNVEHFGELVPWLMLNRGPLSILIHPNTDHARADHTGLAAWLGTPLAVVEAVLPETNEAEGPYPATTTPSIKP